MWKRFIPIFKRRRCAIIQVMHGKAGDLQFLFEFYTIINCLSFCEGFSLKYPFDNIIGHKYFISQLFCAGLNQILCPKLLICSVNVQLMSVFLFLYVMLICLICRGITLEFGEKKVGSCIPTFYNSWHSIFQYLECLQLRFHNLIAKSLETLLLICLSIQWHILTNYCYILKTFSNGNSRWILFAHYNSKH